MNDREYYDRLASAYLRGRAERMSQEGPDIRAEGEKQEEKLYYFKRSPEKLPRVRMALGFLRSVWPESLLDVGSVSRRSRWSGESLDGFLKWDVRQKGGEADDRYR